MDNETRWRNQIQYRVVAMVLLSTVLPFAGLLYWVNHSLTSQTLSTAEAELQSTTDAYARSIQERLEYLDVSLRFMIQVAPDAVQSIAPNWEPSQSDEGRGQPTRVTPMRRTATGIAMRFDLLDGYVWIPLDAAMLLFDIDAGQSAVRRCVELNGEPWRCAEREPFDNVLVATASVPVTPAFDTDIALVIRSELDRAMALGSTFAATRALPLLLLFLYMLTVGVLLRVIRQRLAPLASLQRATRRIEQGDYGFRVEIETGDELESLGEAFNRMSERLLASFTALRALATMDRAILSAARPDEVVVKALQYCANARVDAAVVLLGEAQTGRVKLWRWQDGRIAMKLLDKYHGSGPAGRGSLAELVVWLRESTRIPFDDAIGLVDDSGPAGALLIRGSGKTLAQPLLANVHDVADRLSLALTHLNRAHDLLQFSFVELR
jgi:HAMP domain-containing protein